MPSSTASLSKADWIERIQPHLSTSLQDASDAITNTDAIQSWLHRASFEAAEGLAQMHGMQAEAQGYLRMLNSLEDELPALVEAVDELTLGCGRLDLSWRPLTPNFSRVSIDFGRDVGIQVFCRIDDATREAVRDALRTVARALPKGDPFPNRPNDVTGLLATPTPNADTAGHSLVVRIHEHHRDDEAAGARTVSLLPASGDPHESLPAGSAAEHVLNWIRDVRENGGDG